MKEPLNSEPWSVMTIVGAPNLLTKSQKQSEIVSAVLFGIGYNSTHLEKESTNINR